MVKPISIPFWKAYWLNKVVPVVVQYVLIFIKIEFCSNYELWKDISTKFYPNISPWNCCPQSDDSNVKFIAAKKWMNLKPIWNKPIIN